MCMYSEHLGETSAIINIRANESFVIIVALLPAELSNESINSAIQKMLFVQMCIRSFCSRLHVIVVVYTGGVIRVVHFHQQPFTV